MTTVSLQRQITEPDPSDDDDEEDENGASETLIRIHADDAEMIAETAGVKHDSESSMESAKVSDGERPATEVPVVKPEPISLTPAKADKPVKLEKPSPAARKRRWGSTVKTEKESPKPHQKIISSNSLKGIIPTPNLQVVADIGQCDVMEVEDGQLSEDDDTRFVKQTAASQPSMTEDNETTERSPPRRIVTKRENGVHSKKAKVPRWEASKDKEEIPEVHIPIRVDEPIEAKRELSPARHPVSCVLHIRNLVRPYTINQLKQLLNRSGALLEDGFWIDGIKSHCYAMYATGSEATSTREALHGTKWPSSNPKCIHVDYTTVEELLQRQGKIPPKITDNIPDDVAPRDEARRPRREPAREPRKASPVGRERRVAAAGDNVQSPRRRSPPPPSKRRSRSPFREEPRHEREKRERERVEKLAKVEEPPAKLLDDLFRKTKAIPCIYWLPLTDAQATEREVEKQKLEDERKERLKKREEKEKQELEERIERRRKEREARRDRSRSRSYDRRRH